MEIEKFVENFADQMEWTELEELSPKTRFREEIEEWDSLKALSIQAMTDAEYGVTLKGEDIRNSNTIEDLYNIVKSRL